MVYIGYHGTNTKIEAWDLEHLGSGQGQSIFPGIYFATSYLKAKEWADIRVEQSGGKPVVYIAEVELNHPLDSRKREMIFSNLGDFVKFARKYFPGWFDSNGRLLSIKTDYVKEKFSTYSGQYNFIKYAAEENLLPVIDVCKELGFDSVIDLGEIAILSPQQILSFQETDHHWTDEELNQHPSLPAEESIDRDLLATGFYLPAFETKSDDYVRLGKSSRKYKTKPGNRFTQRVRIKANGGNSVWFDLDMNRLFKRQSFAVKIPVIGETDEYTCVISFESWLPKLKEDIRKFGFTQLTVKKSLAEMMRFHDLKTRCSCPDYHYRMAYQSSQHGDIEGEPETIPSPITNPKDDLGRGCKHLLFCLNNKWIYFDKISRIIYNYFINLKRTQKPLFDRIIAPALGLEEIDQSQQTSAPTPEPAPSSQAKPEEEPIEENPEEAQEPTQDETTNPPEEGDEDEDND